MPCLWCLWLGGCSRWNHSATLSPFSVKSEKCLQPKSLVDDYMILVFDLKSQKLGSYFIILFCHVLFCLPHPSVSHDFNINFQKTQPRRVVLQAGAWWAYWDAFMDYVGALGEHIWTIKCSLTTWAKSWQMLKKLSLTWSFGLQFWIESAVGAFTVTESYFTKCRLWFPCFNLKIPSISNLGTPKRSNSMHADSLL